MHITDYFQQIEKLITECPAIIMEEVSHDQRTSYLGFIKGILTFIDSSQLYFKEFIDTQEIFTKYKYGYHYQKDNNLIFRYDNHVHSPKSPIHHKHLPSQSELIPAASAPILETILKEIISLLP